MKTMMKTTAAALALLALPTTAMAATDGTQGPISQGTMQVSITVNNTDELRVYGLEDIDLGTVATTGGVEVSGFAGFCVTRNTAGNIRLSLDSQESPGSLALFVPGAGSSTVPVTVRIWRPGGSASTDTFGAPGFIDSPPSAMSCNASSSNFNDGFGIGVTAQGGAGLPDGTYTNIYTPTATPL